MTGAFMKDVDIQTQDIQSMVLDLTDFIAIVAKKAPLKKLTMFSRSNRGLFGAILAGSLLQVAFARPPRRRRLKSASAAVPHWRFDGQEQHRGQVGWGTPLVGAV